MALVKVEQGTVAHRAIQVAGYAALAAFALWLPHLANPSHPFRIGKALFQIGLFNRILVYVVAIMAVNLVTGYTGQISLGHGAFVGVGAYTSAILISTQHWGYTATLPAAIVLGFIVGVVIGIPALRIKGLYLAIVTTAVAVAFPTLVLKFGTITGGVNGKKPCWKGGITKTKLTCPKINPPGWARSVFGLQKGAQAQWTYFLLLFMAIVVCLLTRNLIRSRVGRAMIAIRDRETAAAVSGVNTRIYKVITFGVSGSIAAVAGVMYLMQGQFISDVDFNAGFSLFLIVGIVAGGVASLSGAWLGALLIILVPHVTGAFVGTSPRPHLSIHQIVPISKYYLFKQPTVLFGVLLLILVFLMPYGITDGMRRLRLRFLQVTPHPSWLEEAKEHAVSRRAEQPGFIPPPVAEPVDEERPLVTVPHHNPA
ncbi:MAG: hypothetical protein NVS3B12_02670 [Acidimicrobiales bacterium]